MNIINWIKSEYVTFIGIARLSFVWRVSPSKMEGRPPLCALTFRADSIAHLAKSGNSIISSDEVNELSVEMKKIVPKAM